MSLSLAELNAVAAALRPRLVGGQIQGLRQPDEQGLILEIRGREAEANPDEPEHERPAPGPGASWSLLFSLRPRLARVHLTWQPRPPRPPRPLAFDQRLRATILDGRLRAVLTPWPDRILVLDIQRGEQSYWLLAELGGHHTNLFLLDDEGRILAVLRPSSSRRRDLRPGQPYVAPDPVPGGDEAAPTLRGEALLRSLDETYASREREAAREQRRAALHKRCRSEQTRLARRAEHLRADLARAEEAEVWRAHGDLLKGALHTVQKGDTEARLTDWSAAGSPTIVVPLDPARSPRENLAALFARYKKAQRGRPQVERRLAETEQAAARVAALLAALADADDEGLAALEIAAREAGLAPRAAGGPAAPKREKQGRRVAYRRYQASDGTELLVGKGGADNGVLTFRVARDNDLWLHVRDAAGAHVVIRTRKGQTTSRETMIEAALLAAHFSKRRGEPRVEVHLTPRRLVRPLPGAPAGTVRVERSESLLVETDEARLARLLATLVERAQPVRRNEARRDSTSS